jgi:hypothetical protein
VEGPVGANLQKTPELVGGAALRWSSGRTSLTLNGEDVAVIQLK